MSSAPSVQRTELKYRSPKNVANDETDRIDVTYKVLLLGDTGVGKTSLIRTLTGKPFCHNLLTTVGIDFVKMTFEVDNAKICLQIWDTAGQERFRSLTKNQYRGTKGLLLVYDITNRKSFDTLTYWINSIEKELEQSSSDTVPVIVVGNKCDLTNRRKVTEEEGQGLSNRNFLSGFFETSAVDRTNVRECFQKLAHDITDINHPQLMSMYKYSAAIDKAKATGLSPSDPVVTETRTTTATVGSSSSVSKAINLKKHHSKKKCPCWT